MEFLENLCNKLKKMHLENKYNLIFEFSSNEKCLHVFNKNNNNYLLVAILEDPDYNYQLRVYTDDDYLVIEKSSIIDFLINYFNEYFQK